MLDPFRLEVEELLVQGAIQKRSAYRDKIMEVISYNWMKKRAITKLPLAEPT